jgi:hypothetical protein
MARHSLSLMLAPMVGLSTAVATWVPIDTFHVAHPSLQLEDELIVEGGEVL